MSRAGIGALGMPLEVGGPPAGGVASAKVSLALMDKNRHASNIAPARTNVRDISYDRTGNGIWKSG